MIVELIWAEVRSGMAEPSTTRSRSIPRTLISGSKTQSRPVPMGQVEAGCSMVTTVLRMNSSRSASDATSAASAKDVQPAAERGFSVLVTDDAHDDVKEELRDIARDSRRVTVSFFAVLDAPAAIGVC